MNREDASQFDQKILRSSVSFSSELTKYEKVLSLI
jgi:hypothetical protein